MRDYTDEEIGKIRIVKDFLPKPENLVLREEPVRVTILLNKNIITYFKKEAAKNHTHYQTMIRSLLNTYTDNHWRY